MTTPPPLDEQLTAFARERSRDDELLERLAAGTLTASERLELERRAAADEELRETMALCQPVDDAAHGAIIDRITQAPSNVVALKPRSARRWVVGGLALAAGLTAAVLLPQVLHDTPPVGYSLELGGDAKVRGADPVQAPSIGPTSLLTLVARPSRAVTPPRAVHVFVAPVASQQFRPLDVGAQRSPDGAVRVAFEGSLLGAPDTYLVRVVLEGETETSLEARVELTP